MKRFSLLVALFFLLSLTAHAQSFNSGSTGADGALDLSASDREIQLPESGVLNYTTVSVPSGRTLTFKRNLRNTPVIMLAQSDVIIAGGINVSAPGSYDYRLGGRIPGAGGFYGGEVEQPGFGPGGGPLHVGGRWVGPLSLVPIVGGSGGAGIGGCYYGANCEGGGGGGAIVIASSASIVLQSGSSINANGSIGDPYNGRGTLGSGGAIRLVANSLNVAGRISACGGNCGVVRLEAPSGSLTFTGSSNPAAVLSSINPVVVSNTPPQLTIVSIGGHAVPSYAGSRFDTVDLLLPNQLTDPINVVVQANNIPLGTQVNVRAVNGSPQATYTPGTLSGTFASSTATATMSNLNRTGVTYLLATATFDPPSQSMQFNQKGANQVSKVRVEATPGAKPKYVFLRSNGSVIETVKLSPQFLQQFGM